MLYIVSTESQGDIMKSRVFILILPLFILSWVQLPPFRVLKYSTLTTNQVNCDAVVDVEGDSTRVKSIAVVNELVAHYRQRGFTNIYIGLYRDTRMGRRICQNEFYEPPEGQLEANWLCVYTKIDTSETIQFRPWDWQSPIMDVDYFKDAAPTVTLSGTIEKPEYRPPVQ